jgi:hypothetical protein
MKYLDGAPLDWRSCVTDHERVCWLFRQIHDARRAAYHLSERSKGSTDRVIINGAWIAVENAGGVRAPLDDRAAAFRARHAEYFAATSPADRVAYVRKLLAERGESEEYFLARLMRILEE